MSINNDAIKPWQTPAKTGKIGPRQKGYFGMRMGASNVLKGLKTKNQIAQSTKANDENMIFNCSHFCSFWNRLIAVSML
jgi:hypothetical protein